MKKMTKEFDSVSFFRAEKERIAKDISNMTFEALKEYLSIKSQWINKKEKPTHSE